ncbi:MAG: DUF2384 domain-containing protein [Balneolales bacterium]|nr:DUF2384 domain-containing protein [Balneolales bacterium]
MNAENDKKKSTTNDVIVPYVVNDLDNWQRKLAYWLADLNPDLKAVLFQDIDTHQGLYTDSRDSQGQVADSGVHTDTRTHDGGVEVTDAQAQKGQGRAIETATHQGKIAQAANPYSMIAELGIDRALVNITNQGLHPDIIEQLLQEKLVTREEVYDIVIKQRTLSHRQINKQRLTSDETDRLLRLLRMKAIVAVFFGSLDKGNEWLNEPNDGYGGTKPISLIQSESGARLVEQTLERIAWGVIS